MKSKKEKRKKKSNKNNMKLRVLISAFIGMTIAIAIFMTKNSLPLAWVGFCVGFILPIAQFYLSEKMKASKRIKRMEELFPDFLQLMSSNLRAGITIDRAMLLSAREEFDPLDKEILKTGRDITTGKEIEIALLDMSKRIGSPRIHKTILLILSGLKSGGDIAIILEQTATSIRERAFVEKKASSSVLMYVIFIFLAVSVGAPALFGLSNILVEILTNLLSGLPTTEVENAPFTLSSISISTTFILWFSVIFIVLIDILASLVLGLINKGEEKEGLKYLVPLLIISLSVFFLVKIILSGFVKSFFVAS